MIPRTLAIGIILAAIVVAIIVASGVVRLRSPGHLSGQADRVGIGAKTRRRAPHLSVRQPGEHVDPRGGVQLGPEPDDGRLQQPGDVQPGRAAEPDRHDRARSGDEVVVERRHDRAHLSAPARRELARRQAVHRRGRQMHLGPDPRQGSRTSCAPIRASLGTATWTRSAPKATR